MPSTPLFEVVVVAYRSRGPLTAFLESLGGATPVVVVDNSGDVEDISGLLDRFPRVRRVDAGRNLGFSAAANLGAGTSTAPYLVFMNPDTLPSEGSIRTMIDVLSTSPELASCGATGLGTAGGGAQPSPGRVVAHALGLHRLFSLIGVYYYPKRGERVAVEWVSGSCLAVRRSDFEAVGGFDESYFVFMSDFELGRRFALNGRRQMLLGDVAIPHVDGGSSDLPSQWVWEERAKGWAQYLARTMPRPRGTITGAILWSGYVGRWGLYTAVGKSAKARELRTYARALVTEWRSETRRTRARRSV